MISAKSRPGNGLALRQLAAARRRHLGSARRTTRISLLAANGLGGGGSRGPAVAQAIIPRAARALASRARRDIYRYLPEFLERRPSFIRPIQRSANCRRLQFIAAAGEIQRPDGSALALNFGSDRKFIGGRFTCLSL